MYVCADDIMKVEALLPTVHAEHSPYYGYQTGDVIGDHDVALAYVLDFYGAALPSFEGLPPEHQRSVRFTQSKMSFNHGWLVQVSCPSPSPEHPRPHLHPCPN
jgi:hypothetical protein